jgi:hypothetical protein
MTHSIQQLGALGAAVVIVVALNGGLASNANAQSAPTQQVATEPADETLEKWLGQTVTLKDGRTMSFAEIAKLPKEQKHDVFDNQMTDEQFAQWEAFQQWQIQEINQRNKEADKRIQAQDRSLYLWRTSLKILDELAQEQGKPITTQEQRIKNQERAAILLDMVNDENIKKRIKNPALLNQVQVIAKGLQTGDIQKMNAAIVKELSQ